MHSNIKKQPHRLVSSDKFLMLNLSDFFWIIAFYNYSLYN
jgi:hypothetical protein